MSNSIVEEIVIVGKDETDLKDLDGEHLKQYFCTGEDSAYYRRSHGL